MKKEWINPEFKNLGIDLTATEDYCSEDHQGEIAAACFCEHYDARHKGGCGGCKAPGYICKWTNKKPCLIKQCVCNSIQTDPS